MQLPIFIVLSLGSTTLAALERRQYIATTPCYNDNCARAVTGTVRGSSHPSTAAADCKTNFIITSIPQVITVTVTTPGDAPISTSEPVISIPDSGFFPSMPAYASPCGDFIAYQSACSCFGYPPTTLAFPTPTATVYVPTITSAPPTTTSSPPPTCTNTLTDPSNCGTCGTICPSGVCEGGSCVDTACDAQTCGGFTNCQGTSNCFCFTSTNPGPGNGFCGENAVCSDLTACASDTDCLATGSSGNICAVNTCCPAPSETQPGVCLVGQCGNPASLLRMLARARRAGGATAAF